MCGGGGGGRDDSAQQRRHEEQMALQREQMAEQKRQFDLQLAQSEKRFKDQKAAAEADPAPAPNPIAETAAPSTAVPDPLYAANQTAGGMDMQQTLAIAPRAQGSGIGRRRFRTSGTNVAGGAGGLSIPG